MMFVTIFQLYILILFFFKLTSNFKTTFHYQNGRHYVILIDPGISAGEPRGTYLPFDEGVKEDIFIKDNEGNLLIGKVFFF